MTKQPPVTRAADWPSWVIDAQRPATSRLSNSAGGAATRQHHRRTPGDSRADRRTSGQSWQRDCPLRPSANGRKWPAAADANVSRSAGQRERQVLGNVIAGRNTGSRPFSDIRCSELVAKEQSIVSTLHCPTSRLVGLRYRSYSVLVYGHARVLLHARARQATLHEQ